LAILEVGGLQNYPYFLELKSVDALDGSPAPVAFFEYVSPVTSSCPQADGTCLQLFRFGLPYDVCQLNAYRYRFNFRYAAPGLPDPTFTIKVSSESWCAETPIVTNAPVITSLEPAEVIHGNAFDLIIRGNNLAGISSPPAVRIQGNNIAPTTWSNSEITLHLSDSILSSYRGVLPIQVVTDVATSNSLSILVK
jgi:hypothetical protein